MTLKHCLLVIIGSLAFYCEGAVAQTSNDHDIVVQGRLTRPNERVERAAQFIKQLRVISGDQQVARWIDPICPRVLELEPEYAKIITDQIRSLAQQSNAPVAGADCRPNIIVSFTSDGAGLARRLHQRAPTVLNEVPSEDLKALLSGPAPVRWWYRTKILGSDGREMTSGPSVAAPFGGEGGGSLIPDKPTLNVYGSSLVSTYGIRTIASATVIVDINAAHGVSLKSVAMYIAMVSLAEIRQRDQFSDDTVLSLFQSNAIARTLSTSDTAFLNALYSIPLDRVANRQRSALAIRMAKAEQ